MRWLFEAKKRFGVSVLNYIATSNHVHLLVSDDGSERKIPAFMQLVQGRTAQEYNYRTNRKGAYWEDRYHATAIASDEHIIRCMTYISMNMVRAGRVEHPIKWEESGFYEIMHPRQRYTIIDYASIMKILGVDTMEQLQDLQQEWIKDTLKRKSLERESIWTESIAVGNEAFLEKIRHQLNIKVKSRRIKRSGDSFELSEPLFPYNTFI